MIDILDPLLGLSADELTAGQMALRAVLTFVVTVAIVRLGHKRMFGKETAFDLVVAVMVGSVMSRAITNATGLVSMWVAGFVLIMLHRLTATLAYHHHGFGPVVKGQARRLVQDGSVDGTAMRKGHITTLDLDQAMRMKGHEPDSSRLRLAYLERDGSISVVPRRGEARVVEVNVEDNVQVVKIVLD